MGRGPTAWPLVGRESELAVLARCVEGGGAIVAGGAGVGKTRLAREVAAAAQAAGRPVVSLVATRSARAYPLAPFARFGATGDLRRALLAGHEPGRLLLSVDDGHMLDEASARLVHELRASGAASLLVTLRSREPVPEAVMRLEDDGLCERIELPALTHALVARLLVAVLAAPVDETTVFALCARSGGNVLHLQELVRRGLASGALGCAGGRWAWRGELRAPPRLVELLVDRLDGLEGPARRALVLLALGEPLTWHQFVGLVPADLARSLADDGMIEVADDLTVRLAHPLLADVLQFELTEAVRLRLLRVLAPVIDAAADPVRAASWRLDAGLPTPPEVLLAASRACMLADPPAGRRFADLLAQTEGATDI